MSTLSHTAQTPSPTQPNNSVDPDAFQGRSVPSDAAAAAAPDDGSDCSDGSEDGDYNLLVAGLTRDIGDGELRAMFEEFGTVKRAIVMLKANTATSRGFGFVLFGSAAEGKRAQEALNGTALGPNFLNVRRSKHDGKVEEGDSVFVRNIPKVVPPHVVRAVIEHALHTQVRQLKITAGSTKGVNAVTIELPDVETARAAVDLFHKASFAKFYEAYPHAPPLPPETVPVPDMLAKFAESEQSRTVRHIRKRQERAQAQAAHAHPTGSWATTALEPPAPPPPPKFVASSSSIGHRGSSGTNRGGGGSRGPRGRSFGTVPPPYQPMPLLHPVPPPQVVWAQPQSAPVQYQLAPSGFGSADAAPPGLVPVTVNMLPPGVPPGAQLVAVSMMPQPLQLAGPPPGMTFQQLAPGQVFTYAPAALPGQPLPPRHPHPEFSS